ncbi:MAG TPA: oligosaccharide flippase family protein [Terriglobales bacterium]|nr:oligosaccharide flippase family protein [Terriglobales bacterium]
MRRQAVRSAGATVSASGVSLASQVIGTAVLARLLTPADFGVVTMVTTFSLLLVSFGLNGFTEAVIQCEDIDHYTASNLFWLNLGAGLVVAVAFALSGSLLARFYRNALVVSVAAAVSGQIFITAGSVIHLALLKRAMRFTAVAGNDVASRTVYTAVAIILALRGWGYWALVAGLVASSLSVTVGAWWLCRWIPSLPRRTGRTVPLVRFAASVYVRFGIWYFRQNADNLLVGWRFNAVALGFYKKAYDLFALSASQLTAPLDHVALAALSRLNQDPPRFRQTLANSIGFIAFVGMAVGGDLTLVGKDIVRLVLGPQWGEAGKIFMFFGPGIGIMLLSSTVGWIHLSIGRPDRWLYWSILEFVVTALLFIVALHWGPEGIALAWSASFWILVVPAFWYAGRPIGLRATSFIRIVWKYSTASFVAVWAATGIVPGLPLPSALATAGATLERVVVISAVFVALYLGLVILLHRGCAPLRQLASLVLEFAPVRRTEALQAATEENYPQPAPR